MTPCQYFDLKKFASWRLTKLTNYSRSNTELLTVIILDYGWTAALALLIHVKKHFLSIDCYYVCAIRKLGITGWSFGFGTIHATSHIHISSCSWIKQELLIISFGYNMD